MHRPWQTAVAAGTLATAVLLAAGAAGVRSEAGYSGVGPNFLPWVVAVALAICALFLLKEVLSGGFRDLDPPSGASAGNWPGLAWVSAGILANALLITTLGFIVSCALCFMLAVRGFKASQGRVVPGLLAWGHDFAIGLAIAAPVYWMFTQALGINLPGLTATGWL